MRDDPRMPVTLLYDRDCGFCRWCLGKVLTWDRRRSIRPVAIQSEEADRLLTGVPEELAALTARAPRATNGAYRWVAGNRSRWGKLVSDGAKRRADQRIAERFQAE